MALQQNLLLTLVFLCFQLGVWPQLKEMSERLTLHRPPAYPSAAELLSDIWSLFNDASQVRRAHVTPGAQRERPHPLRTPQGVTLIMYRTVSVLGNETVKLLKLLGKPRLTADWFSDLSLSLSSGVCRTTTL